MTISLKEFIAKGQMGAGGPVGKKGLIEGCKPVKNATAEEITAEAFNQDVLDIDSTTWAEGLVQVKRLIAR